MAVDVSKSEYDYLKGIKNLAKELAEMMQAGRRNSPERHPCNSCQAKATELLAEIGRVTA